MDSEELDQIISKSKNDIEKTIKDKNLTIEDLEQLLGAEKEEENRKTVKKLIKNIILSKKLLKKIERSNGSFENINSIQSSLDDISDIEKLNKLDSSYNKVESIDKLFGTVKDFKDYAKDLDLDSNEAELFLKVEISGKNRKGVKDYLKNKIEYFRDSTDEEERKKELREELNLDISDKLFEKVSLEKLENIKREKSYRETLISDISEETGESPERLRKASTSDLEKISSEMDDR